MSAATVETLRVTETATPEAPVQSAPKKRALPFRPRTLVAAVVALAAVTTGAVYIMLPPTSVSTEAAYISADSSIVSTRVRGIVAEVLVKDNETVRAGQPLLRIDGEEFAARLASAEADARTADAAVLAAKAALGEHAAQLRLADSDILASRAAIVAAEAQAQRTTADKDRFDRLGVAGAASRRDIDLANAAAASSSAEVVRLTAKLGVSQGEAAAVGARRATLQAGVAGAEAAAARAQAAVDLARQDSEHTLITAPVDGVVGDRKTNVGDYVQPGTRVMTVVPMASLYVIANFKETQVSRMLAGQRASIEIDALPGVRLKGKVESFAPGSGSQFSLLPFEPGTGNFTKVVQRVPVRIVLDPGQPELARLRPGLSTRVEVKLN